MKSSSVFARVAASLLAINSLLVHWIKVHSIHILKTHSSRLPACMQLRSEIRANSWRLRSRPLHWEGKRNEGHVGLHRSRCHCADFETWKAQSSGTWLFGALNSLEKYRNCMLCSQCMEILQPGEKGHGGQQNVSETSDGMCMFVPENGLRPSSAASQAQS
jgi:hypothetical protein